MKALVERLPWDSEFFDFPIGKISSSAEDWSAVTQNLSTVPADLQLLYWCEAQSLSDPPPEAGPFLVRKMPGRLIFRRELPATENFLPAGPGIILSEQIGPREATELRPLALLSGKYSRFRLDPGFSERQFNRFYLRWLENSLQRDFADTVVVAKLAEEGPCVGLLTLKKRGELGQIGLVAVLPAAGRRGVARAMLRYGFVWARAQGCRRMEVATQDVNEAARALYVKTGFTLAERYSFYHLWRQRFAPKVVNVALFSEE